MSSGRSPAEPGPAGGHRGVSVEGCSIAEAARRLGKSETAIRRHRGLNAISARFGRG
jgi:RNA polymerase sigma-70 factor (ECF subfamily)